MIEDEFAGQGVQVVGDHAGHDVRREHVEALSGELARDAHAFEIRLGVRILICPVRRSSVEDVIGHGDVVFPRLVRW